LSATTPILAAIKEYCQKSGLRLHMPGHAGCKNALPAPFHGVIDYDLTEISGLDDLHWPSGPIKAAQELLARAFGAAASYFLVNGASSGIHSFFLGLGQNSKVLVARNAHRSVFAGMVFSGAQPVYIPCQVNEHGLALAVTAGDVAALLQEHLDVKAVALVSPSFYGTTSHIADIALLLKQRGIPLMVDEAHGGHFYFNPDYPPTALAGGADVVINGLHKTLPVLTQGACLHIGNTCPNPDRFVQARSLLTTTSPSYLIMASIDLARDWMDRYGREALERALCLSHEYRQKINRIKGIRCLSHELLLTGVEALDPLKMLISVDELAEDGIVLAKRLSDEWNIEVEWKSRDIILAMMSIFHDKEDWQRLYEALYHISRAVGCKGPRKQTVVPPLPLPQVQISPREAYFASKTAVSLKDSIGKISGEMVVPYPPGIPCLLPGEQISAEVYMYLDELLRTGYHIQGLDANSSKISIIDQT
jgi:arginine decarboxylase